MGTNGSAITAPVSIDIAAATSPPEHGEQDLAGERRGGVEGGEVGEVGGVDGAGGTDENGGHGGAPMGRRRAMKEGSRLAP